MYGWIITKVYDEDCQVDVGISGPRDCDQVTIEMLEDARLKQAAWDENVLPSEIKRFRMYTDDLGDPDCNNGLVYEGLFWQDESGDFDDMSFGPLDDFGAVNYGCAHIAYLEDGKWVMI